MKMILVLLTSICAACSAQAACPNAVSQINPAIGATVHVTVVDQNCVAVTPGGVVAVGSPNPSGFVQVIPDATGLNFKGLAAGQFNYTLSYPVGPTPFPSTALTVVVGSMPTAISATSP